MRTPAGDVNDGLGNPGAAAGDDRFSAEIACRLTSGLTHVNRDNPSTESHGDHHSRQAHAAATMHGKPLAGRKSGPFDDRVIRGGETAAQCRSF